MKIRVFGPIDDVSGYGEIARQVLFTMQNKNIEVSAQTQNWGCTPIELPLDLQKKINILKHRKHEPDCHLFISVPTFFRKKAGIPAIGLTMSEVDGIHSEWANHCNKMDLILAPSNFNRATFSKSGVIPEKIKILPLGVDSTIFSSTGPQYNLGPLNSYFTFLSVGEWVPRKGFDILITAFVREFNSHDRVRLVLRCHNNGSDYDSQGKRINNQIKNIIKGVKNPAPPPVILVPQAVSSKEMPALYRSAHCFVSATRGEGWSMPAFEALACGVPVITTKWSAYLDFLNDDNAYLINVEALEGVPALGISYDKIYVGHRWARPSISHLGKLMRTVYQDYQTAKEKAARGQALVREQLRWDLCTQRIIQYFSELLRSAVS